MGPASEEKQKPFQPKTSASTMAPTIELYEKVWRMLGTFFPKRYGQLLNRRTRAGWDSRKSVHGWAPGSLGGQQARTTCQPGWAQQGHPAGELPNLDVGNPHSCGRAAWVKDGDQEAFDCTTRRSSKRGGHGMQRGQREQQIRKPHGAGSSSPGCHLCPSH